MASASEISAIENNEQLEHVTSKADICDNILSTHRSMPNKTVRFTAAKLTYAGFHIVCSLYFVYVVN